jgi:hypothetical protein
VIEKMEESRGGNLRNMRILKPTKRMVVILVLTSICVGCARGGYNTTQGAGSRLDTHSIDKKIGANHPPILVMDSIFTYQDTNFSSGKPNKVTTVMVVEEKKEFEKKMAYWINVRSKKDNYFNIYDMDLNWIGQFGEGKKSQSAEPCIRVFKWPLRIGEKWSSEYTLRDYSRGVHLHPSKIEVNVRTYEKVTVPAGTFNALRIQAGEETVWYAPSIGWAVKEQIGSCGKDGWLLELAEYKIPHRIVKKE